MTTFANICVALVMLAGTGLGIACVFEIIFDIRTRLAQVKAFKRLRDAE